MRRIPSTVILLLLACLAFSQTPQQRAGMLNATNVNALQSIRQQLQAQKAIDQQAVELYAQQNNIPIREVLPDGSVRLLVKILPNNHPMYTITTNVNSAISIGANQVHVGGALGLALDGDGFYIGEWDGGAVLDGHEQYAGRTHSYDTGSTSSHSTHVCGTMIGDGTGVANAKGMAPAARVESWDFSDDGAEMAAEAAGDGASPHAPFLVSNHSYGTISGWYYQQGLVPTWRGDPAISTEEDYKFGWYNDDAALFDQIANNTPYYLIFKSAGNDRGDYADLGATGANAGIPSDGTGESPGDGYDCVSTYGNAKNIMTVGAVEDVIGGYSGPSSVVMSSFSGWGPSDDGRIKPDIVTNGVGLNSSDSGGVDDYGSKSGTSMATPSAAGAAILLQEHYSETHGGDLMLSSTLKGLIIHTANEAGNTGPDYSFGWGLMNVPGAVELISEDLILEDHISENTLTDGGMDSKSICMDGNSPLRITIAWNDPAATATPVDGDVLDNPIPKLINDLDIRLTDAAGTTTYMPYILDKDVPSKSATTGDNLVDNVEQIYVEGLTAGEYVLTISHKGNLQGGLQDYSLIISGNNSADVLVDAGIAEIQGLPDGTLCQSSLSICPSISVQNFTCNTLPSIIVNYKVNNGVVTSVEIPQALMSGEVIEAPLGEITLSEGAHTFTAWTSFPAGIVDENLANDELVRTFNLVSNTAELETMPYLVNFSDGSITDSLAIDNPDEADTWENYDNSACNRGISAMVNNYNYNAAGQEDGLVTPTYDLANILNPHLRFDLAYAPYSSSSFETLQVRVIDACSNTSTIIWQRSGLGLSTNGGGGLGTGSYRNNIPMQWEPACEDFTTVEVNLSAFIGQVVQVGIYNINGYGNDIFVDDIKILGESCGAATPIATEVSNFCNAAELTANDAPVDHTYQWYVDGKPIFGATDKTYTATTGGDYTVTFIGACKYGVSEALAVTVETGGTPSISTDCATLNREINLNTGCEVIVPDLRSLVSATDDCGGAPAISQNPVALSALSSAHNSTHTITMTATSGQNTTDCVITLTGKDVTGPIITTNCRDLDMNVDLGSNCEFQMAAPDLTSSIAATDNCNAANEISFSQSPMPGEMLTATGHNSSSIVTLTATDVGGNRSDCIVVFTGQDVTPPSITTDCTTLNANINLDENCEYAIPNLIENLVATDDCSTANEITFTQSPPLGETISTGHNAATTITLTAFDAAGLSSTCQVTLTGQDATAPSIATDCTTLNANINLDESCAFAAPNLTGSLTAIDNCTAANAITFTQSPNVGESVASGHNTPSTITLIATDAAGQSSTCEVILTGQDVTAPSFSTDCTTLNDNINLDSNCEFTVPNLTSSLAATDNCSAANEITFSQSPDVGETISTGHNAANTITLTATDAAGQSSTCQVTLTGQDSTAPSIGTDCTTLNDNVNLDGNCEFTVPNLTSSLAATDNCSAANEITFSQSPDVGETISTGHNATNIITLTATDAAGQSSTCQVTLTGQDSTAPSISTDCTTLNDNVNLDGNCEFTVPNLTSSLAATDNCSAANEITFSQSPDVGETISTGHNATSIITLTATDAAGQSSTCQVMLTGQDATAPSITTDCSTLNADVDLNNNCQSAAPNLISSITVTDNCTNVDDLVITQSPNVGEMLSATSHDMTSTVMLTVTDAVGQSSNCMVTLTSRDNANPTAVSKNISVELDENGTVSITGEDVNNNSADNCSIATYEVVPNTFNAAGEYEVELRVADDAGNVSTAAAMVIVTSSALPLKLLHFTATAKNRESWLHWQVAPNHKAVRFVVEWSIDGKDWMSVGEVEAESELNRYDLIHTTPVLGWNYYRLMQLEEDGSTDYSQVVQLSIKDIKEEAIFFPNPTTDEVQIILPQHFNTRTTISTRIYNIEGQLLKEVLWNSGSPLQLDDLPGGLYQIQMVQDGQMVTGRVVKMD